MIPVRIYPRLVGPLKIFSGFGVWGLTFLDKFWLCGVWGLTFLIGVWKKKFGQGENVATIIV